MTTTEQGLLAAILAEPDSDDLRLIYADAIAEQGDEERAEFIRLQIALAKPERCEWEVADGAPCPQYNARRPSGRVLVWCPACARLVRMRERERHLRNRVGRRLMCELGHTMGGFVWTLHPNDSDYPDYPKVYYRRGFIEEVWLRSLEWWRHGPLLVRRCPLQRVAMPDKQPADVSVISYRWTWFEGNSNAEHSPRHLPSKFFRHLSRRIFDSIEQANAALSGAALTFARATLPSPTAPPGRSPQRSAQKDAPWASSPGVSPPRRPGAA